MYKRPLLDSDNSQRTAPVENMKYGSAEPYKVLLFTIIRPDKPIDVNIFHKICTPLGRVIRIVIFRTIGIQAMIEISISTFENIETARKVKDALNGEDIYADCCTLKIEFAVPQLTVLQNNMDSWDYTNPHLGPGDMEEAEPKTKKPLLHEAPPIQDTDYHRASPHAGHTPSWGEHNDYNHSHQLPLYDHVPPPSRGHYQDYGEADNECGLPPSPSPYIRGFDDIYPPPIDKYRESEDAMEATAYDSGPEQRKVTSVFIVYHLNAKMANCDRLFNLFCLYGNVIRIRWKSGCAMVEMSDSASVKQCVKYLQYAQLFGGKIQLGFTNRIFVNPLEPYRTPTKLLDGTPAHKDFTGSILQRFGKNRVKFIMEYPTKLLVFFDTPIDFSEEYLFQIFDKAISSYAILKQPIKVTFFPPKDKKTSGSLMFEEVADALNALAFINNTPVDGPDGKSYYLKLSFYMPKPSKPKYKAANF